MTDSKNMHVRPILKAHLSTKLTNSQQIAILETLPKCHLTALRAGFILQRELSLPIVHNTMAEFLYRGKFSSNKNILHYQTVNDSILIYDKQNSKRKRRRVSFQSNLGEEKPEKQIQFNFSALLKTTFYSISFKELSLAKID